METLVIIVTFLFTVTIGILAVCFTESKGRNTKYARRTKSAETGSSGLSGRISNKKQGAVDS